LLFRLISFGSDENRSVRSEDYGKSEVSEKYYDKKFAKTTSLTKFKALFDEIQKVKYL
jgi:hypothetical protein